MTKKLSLFALVATLVLPAVSLAATYHYVDTSGTVRSVEATSATDAMNNAVNMAPHSGVALDQGVLDSGDKVTGGGTMSTGNSTPVANQYHYVDVTGTVRNITASSPAQALALAVNKDPHSGVIADAGVLESGDSVNGN